LSRGLMNATIDIDVGGTFTDCLVAHGDRIARSKAPTTAYNLSVGFRRAVEDAARQLDLTLAEILQKTAVIRYSTTLAMNTLIQRTGPRLGLITTAGQEHMLLVGRSRAWADGLHPRERRYMYLAKKPEPLISHDMTVGVRERIDCFGNVVIPLQKEDVRQKIQTLVDRGARGFVVSLLWSFLNPDHERLVREVIQEEYPDRYLGNMPVLLSSEVQPKWHEYPRTNVTILSAYLHTDMTEQLSALGEELRDFGYRKPLSIINNVGGVAKLSRTRAVDTFGAGPIAGLLGASWLSKLYGFPNVLVTDMGGTSFDYGVIVDGACRTYQDWPVIDRWATETSMVEVNTIGAGGGSIAWLNRLMGDKLEVGPRSAGSNPGPACYDLGGTEPTVTDADVVLGYINPDYFLGGKMRLSREKALKSIEGLAGVLKLTSVEVASHIRTIVDANMGNTILKEIVMRGHTPDQFVVFAYGGAGATHCVDYNSFLKAAKVVTFPFGGVFCAMGGATLDLKQCYEASKHVTLHSPMRLPQYLAEYDEFNRVVDYLKELALRDIKSEGFSPEDVTIALELDMRYGDHLRLTRIASPRIHLQADDDVKAICDAFTAVHLERYGELAAIPVTGINIENFYLFASVPLPKPRLPEFDLEGASPDRALKGTRPVYWKAYNDFEDTPIFDADSLRPGNIIPGPAVVEAKDTTVVLPPGMKYSVDRYMSGIIEGAQGGNSHAR
jgi:N-methylhydantoinase A/oxoprolinase/acetone carboxylase beta subunit